MSRNHSLLVQYLLDVHGKTREFSLFSKAGFESWIYPLTSHHARKNHFSTVKVTGVFTCIVALRGSCEAMKALVSHSRVRDEEAKAQKGC